MGNDAPLACLSKFQPLIYEYFKQLFAQVKLIFVTKDTLLLFVIIHVTNIELKFFLGHKSSDRSFQRKNRYVDAVSYRA